MSLLILAASCMHPGQAIDPPAPGERATPTKPGERTSRSIKPTSGSIAATRPVMDPVIDALSRLAGHGLDPEDYHLSHILSLADDPVAGQAILEQA